MKIKKNILGLSLVALLALTGCGNKMVCQKEQGLNKDEIVMNFKNGELSQYDETFTYESNDKAAMGYVNLSTLLGKEIDKLDLKENKVIIKTNIEGIKQIFTEKNIGLSKQEIKDYHEQKGYVCK